MFSYNYWYLPFYYLETIIIFIEVESFSINIIIFIEVEIMIVLNMQIFLRCSFS
jgi:hypothetical protein